jgi:hypothetical protein
VRGSKTPRTQTHRCRSQRRKVASGAAVRRAPIAELIYGAALGATQGTFAETPDRPGRLSVCWERFRSCRVDGLENW